MRTAPRPRSLVSSAPLLLALAGCGEGPLGIEGVCDPAAAQAAFLAASGDEHGHGEHGHGEHEHGEHEHGEHEHGDDEPVVGIHFAEDAQPEVTAFEDLEGDDVLGEPGAETLSLFGAPEPRGITLFLNRGGGHFLDGSSNSAHNRSPIVPCDSADLAPYAGSDAQWDEIVSCVAEQFAPFDVEITDEEPGSGAFVEAVIGDQPSALGLPRNVGGIAPMDTYGCSVLDRAVVFIFAERIGDENTQRICEVTAQEVGHALGLDHAFVCEDPMSYLKGCGEKTFQNIEARCGEHESRDCACGAQTQNSVQMLARQVGMREGDAPPPPADDTGAPDITFEGAGVSGDVARVTAKITDDVSVSRVDLLWEEAGEELAFRCPGAGERAACRREGDRFQWNVTAPGAAVRFRVRAEDPSGQVQISEPRSL